MSWPEPLITGVPPTVRTLSQPLPTARAVSLPAPAVIPEIFRPVRVPALIPADWISKPLLVILAAAPAVRVLTFRPSIVQLPPVQLVMVGAATLRPLMALVPVAP